MRITGLHIAKDAENIEDILKNDNDVVDDEEFENLKRQEGCNNFQQEMRFKIIGTQLFQKVERGHRRGYRRIKKKYNEAVNALKEKIVAVNVLTEKIDNIGRYNSMLSAYVKICFAQQVSAYIGIKDYGELAIAAITKELIQLEKRAVQNKLVIKAISHETLSDDDKGKADDDDKGKALDAVNIIDLKEMVG